MDPQVYRDRQVRAKSKQVMDYHYNDEAPGKPLHLLIPGGLIALASLALIVFIGYRVWWEGTLAQDTGIPLMAILAPFYIGGVFLFSYGYELYNLPRALRLTAIIVFVTLAAVVIVAVLFVVLGGGGSSRSSKSRSSSSGKNAKAAPASSSGGHWGAGPVILGNFGGGTRTVEREVIREVPVEPARPQPVICPNCGRSYIPEENNFVCPGCGAPSPVRSDPPTASTN